RGLPHLLHANAVAVVIVAVLSDRNVEVELRVTLIRLCLAQIPGGARTADHDPGKAPCPRVRQFHDADVHIALLENAVVGEQAFKVVANLEEGIAKRPDVIDELLGEILVHSAGAEVIRMQAAAGGALVEHHELLALLETPERRRERTDVHGLRGNVEKVREQATDLAIKHANELRAPRNGN